MASLDIRAIAAVTAVIFILTAISPNANAGITCNQVRSDIAPCLSYARNGSGEPSEQCCSGVSRLNSTAVTEADRQVACNCLKNLIAETNLNADAVASIPEKCGVFVPYAIRNSTDCSQVH